MLFLYTFLAAVWKEKPNYKTLVALKSMLTFLWYIVSCDYKNDLDGGITEEVD